MRLRKNYTARKMLKHCYKRGITLNVGYNVHRIEDGITQFYATGGVQLEPAGNTITLETTSFNERITTIIPIKAITSIKAIIFKEVI